MALPTLTDYQAVHDISSTERAILRFGNIPGTNAANDQSSGGFGLMLKATRLSLPPQQIGQVIVPLFGFTRCFRGHRSIEHQLTCSFYEDAKGGSIKTLIDWFDMVCDPKTDDSEPVEVYAIPVQVDFPNTIGEVNVSFELVNVWPVSIKVWDQTEESGPALVDVIFSVDFTDLKQAKAFSNAISSTF